MVCVPRAGRALVRLASLVLRVNRVGRASSALNVNLVHQIVISATRELQEPASALPPLSPTCRHPATVSTVFAVPMDSAHATPAGPPVPMAPHARHVQRASSRPTMATVKVGSRFYPQYTPPNLTRTPSLSTWLRRVCRGSRDLCYLPVQFYSGCQRQNEMHRFADHHIDRHCLP